MRMGQKHPKTTPRTTIEPVWSTIRAIVVFGVSKRSLVHEWRLIEYIRIPDLVSARDELLELLCATKYDTEYYVHSLYYHLCTDIELDETTKNYVLICINEKKLLQSQSFETVCESYFDARKLIETKRICMF